jgi:hypothetical protein
MHHDSQGGGERRSTRAAKSDGEGEMLAKIAEMPEPDRVMAERLHAVITASAPDLAPRLWYGMPAYARDGKIVCFFQPAQKFKTRYATLGFSDEANLDEGAIRVPGAAGRADGYLDAQLMRAIRVIVDIGMHPGYAQPPEFAPPEAASWRLRRLNLHEASTPQ